MSLKIKHWTGWIKAEHLDRFWLKAWRRQAEQTEAKGNELHIFEIPSGQKGAQCVRAIEELLQRIAKDTR